MKNLAIPSSEKPYLKCDISTKSCKVAITPMTIWMTFFAVTTIGIFLAYSYIDKRLENIKDTEILLQEMSTEIRQLKSIIAEQEQYNKKNVTTFLSELKKHNIPEPVFMGTKK